MTSNNPENRFELLKGFQRFIVFAPILSVAVALAVLVLGEFSSPGKEILPDSRMFTGIYGIVLVFLFLTFIPIIQLVFDPDLRKIHVAVRLSVIYRYLFYAWITFFVSRLMLSFYGGGSWPGVVARNILLGILLAASYLLLKKRYLEKPETMFP